jgi:hypothetical protein
METHSSEWVFLFKYLLAFCPILGQILYLLMGKSAKNYKSGFFA